MSTISLDYVKDLIAICREGNLLITYYRDYDVECDRIKELFEYIDENKSMNYNWIKINVSDCPEICAKLGVYPPCTVLYKNNENKYNFGSYSTGDDITSLIKYINEHPIRTVECRDNTNYYPIVTSEDEDDDEDGDVWFFDNTAPPIDEVTNE